VDLEERALSGHPKRIQQSALRIADLRQQTKNEEKRRDSLIVEAYDLGHTRKELADAADIDASRIRQILGTDDD
jgi:hypothetical protein